MIYYLIICVAASIWTLYVFKDMRDVGTGEGLRIPLWFVILFIVVGMIPIINLLLYIDIIVNHPNVELQENNLASKCTKKVINLFNRST